MVLFDLEMFLKAEIGGFRLWRRDVIFFIRVRRLEFFMVVRWTFLPDARGTELRHRALRVD